LGKKTTTAQCDSSEWGPRLRDGGIVSSTLAGGPEEISLCRCVVCVTWQLARAFERCAPGDAAGISLRGCELHSRFASCMWSFLPSVLSLLKYDEKVGLQASRLKC
jgi:hypothetical protein